MKKITKGFISQLTPDPSGKKKTVYGDNLQVAILKSGRITFYVYHNKTSPEFERTAEGSFKPTGKRKRNRTLVRLTSFPNNKLDDRQISILNKKYREAWSNINYAVGERPKDIQEASNRRNQEQWAEITKRTLQMAIDFWFHHHGSNLKTGEEQKRKVEIAFKDELDLPADSLGKEEVAQVLLNVKGTGVQSNRVRSYFRSIINYCYDNGFMKSRDMVERLPRAVREKKRKRILYDHEIRTLWSHMSAIHKFLLLTGQRKSDAVNMNWSHLDLRTRVWANPMTKDGEPHSIVLPQAVIDGLPERDDSLPSVFNSQQRNRYHPNSVQASWDKMLEKVGGFSDTDTGMPKPTIHDLRRTAISHWTTLADYETVKRTANHALGSIDEIYHQALGFHHDKEAQLLEDWHQKLMGIVEEDSREAA